MREILFRGKRIDNGKWVEGNLITNERNEAKKYIGYIFDERNGVVEDFDILEVMPETICQYTGMKDKDGNRIWENDVVEFMAYGSRYIGYVKISKGNTGVMCKNAFPFLDDVLEKWDLKITGNRIDNPELLERS